MRLSDLSAMTEAECNEALGLLVGEAKAHGKRSRVIDAKVRELELRYAMTTVEMKRRFAAGDLKDTADIARWSVLTSNR